MALATSSQLLSTSFFTSKSHDKLPCQERLSTICDRVVYVQPKSVLEDGINGVSSGGWAPSTPKALKNDLTCHGADFGQLSIHALQQGSVILDTDPLSPGSMHTRSNADGTLTELQRLLLEKQWALTGTDFLALKRSALDSSSESNVVRSGRPSARRRRIQVRKQNALSADKHRSHFACRASVIREREHTRLQRSLETVTSLGYMKGTVKRKLLTAEEEVVLSKTMKVGQNLRLARGRLTKIKGCGPSYESWAITPNLPYSEVQLQIAKANRARDKMFMSNLRLVVSVAKKYASLGVSMDDLIQEGAMGLLRGLEKFDHRKGCRLSTYVHWWIRQGITRAITERSRTMRLPAYMHERLGLIKRTAASLKMEGKTANVKSISEALNMSNAKVFGALKARSRVSSLDKMKRWANLNLDEDSMHNYVADSKNDSPWASVDKIFIREDIEALLTTTLSKREGDIVRLHYGLDRADGQCLSLKKISHRIGISRERTRQVEKGALHKLFMSSRDMRLDFQFPS